MTRSYKQRPRRLYERFNKALLAEPAKALQDLQITEPYEQSTAVVSSRQIRSRIAEFRRMWQRASETLLVQHTYCPGETTRRFFARVATKFQDNTIMDLGGRDSYGHTRYQEIAEEMTEV
uniref:Uncharacterized protein n=1 Tax=Peronospora matthiolae TaxID=2874970 RepID=A0AAV1TKA5_9STRA